MAQHMPWVGAEIPTWYPQGSCHGMGPTLFFEDRYEELAKRLCSSCPVRTQCSDWAVNAGPSLYGIWGGTTYNDRQRIRRQRRKEGAA